MSAEKHFLQILNQFYIEILFGCTCDYFSTGIRGNKLASHKIINHKPQITEYEIQKLYEAVGVYGYNSEIFQTIKINWHSLCQSTEGTDGSLCPCQPSQGLPNVPVMP